MNVAQCANVHILIARKGGSSEKGNTWWWAVHTIRPWCSLSLRDSGRFFWCDAGWSGCWAAAIYVGKGWVSDREARRKDKQIWRWKNGGEGGLKTSRKMKGRAREWDVAWVSEELESEFERLRNFFDFEQFYRCGKLACRGPGQRYMSVRYLSRIDVQSRPGADQCDLNFLSSLQYMPSLVSILRSDLRLLSKIRSFSGLGYKRWCT